MQLGGEPATDGPEDAEQRIVIDDDVYREGETTSNETIVVESDTPRDVLVSALRRAAERMMLVGDDGHEYDEVETPRGRDIYTPNYVTDVTVAADGTAGFYIDCKGAIEPPMADQFRKVLLEELKRGGVASARVRVPD